MRNLFLVNFFVLIFSFSNAQKVINYDQNGAKTRSKTEYVTIKITKPSKSGVLGIILGPVYNIASTLIKNKLEKNQKDYTASYSNSAEFSSAALEDGSEIIISRYALNTLNDVKESNLMSRYTLNLKPSPNKNSLIVQLKTIELFKTKAKNKNDNDFSISINLKIASSKGNKEGKFETIEKEGKIIIPIIKIQDKITQNFQNNDLINALDFNGISLDESFLTFSVTITETNINHIDPSFAQQIVASSSDLQILLKSILGLNDK